MSQAGIQPEAAGEMGKTTSIHNSATGDAEVGQNDSYSTLQGEKPQEAMLVTKNPKKRCPVGHLL